MGRSRKRISTSNVVREIARDQVKRNSVGSAGFTNKPTGSGGSVNKQKKQPFNIVPADVPAVADVLHTASVTSIADILLNDAVVADPTPIDDLDLDPRIDLEGRGDVETDRYKTSVIRANSPMWLGMYSSEVQINYGIHQDPLYWALKF